jgi:hypothetical protein
MNDKTKSDELREAWNKLIMTMAEELKLIKFLDWISKKLEKIGF